MTIVNNYGVWIDSEELSVGIMNSNNAPDWFWDDIQNCVELDLENALKEFQENRDPDEIEGEDFWHPDDFEFFENSTYLVGSWKLDNGQWLEDKENGNYSAIYESDGNTISVIWSTYYKRGSLCSPCTPGMIDLDTAGDFMAYCLPEEIDAVLVEQKEVVENEL